MRGIKVYLERLILNSQVERIVFYSDNWNRNKFMAVRYLYIVNCTNISSITHKFLEVGDTQNEGDYVHSVIEKAKKQAHRQVLSMSRYNGHP